jgi:hypothetical protein
MADGETIPWPPGRNEPCWCGSQRKYKKMLWPGATGSDAQLESGDSDELVE